jgi:Ca2+-binding EF-hand superfamily protein
MKNLFAIAAAVILMAGCASVTHTFQNINPFSPPASFRKIDTNGDGVISKSEAKPYPNIAKSFNRIDSNNDGVIGPKEWRAATTFLANHPTFEQYDINGDGVITRREAKATPRGGLNKYFGRVDVDGDGNISPAEFKAATTNLLRGLSFSKIDTDGDGVISKNEAAKVPLLDEYFNRFDVNNDGQISKREFQRFQRRH